MKRLLTLLSHFLPGHKGHGEKSSQPTSKQKKHETENAIIELAREKVLASGLVTDAKEIELVNSTKPSLHYIYFGIPIADYKIRWPVGKATVVVYGRGNILTLEGAHIERRASPDAKPRT